jgi:ABC-type amino acid transport system permease subunit
VPPLGNTLIGLVKGATIMSVIGEPDMVFVASDINAAYFTPFEAFGAVAVVLIVIVLILSTGVALIERWLRLP